MDRATFLYLQPKKKTHNFAQCATCKMFLQKEHLCSLHGKNVRIDATMSCGLYVPGGPAEDSEIEHVQANVTPKESGLVDRKVRCEHCEYYEAGDNDCLLFRMLNISDYKVDPDGCCNAQEPKDEEKKDKRATLQRYVR